MYGASSNHLGIKLSMHQRMNEWDCFYFCNQLDLETRAKENGILDVHGLTRRLKGHVCFRNSLIISST